MSKRQKAESSNLEPDPKPRLGFLGWLRGRFFAGIVVAAPIGITFWLVYSFVTFVDSRVKPLVRSAIPERFKDTYVGNVIDVLIGATPGIGVFLSFIALTLLGAIAANLFGRSMIQIGERILNRVPLVRNIYAALKQIFETLASDRQASFKEVVLVEYPKSGTWAVGFVTSRAKAEVKSKLGERPHIGVFVPTTPNPTSGFLIYVPEDELKHLDMSVEDGAKMIISAGLVVPEDPTLDLKTDPTVVP